MVNRERLIDTFTDLVSIDSPSLGERQVADYLIPILEGLGFTVEEDDAGAALGGNCGNLHALLPGELDLPPLLFSGHMDTVEPSCGKRAVRHEDGRITSDGTTVLGADDFAGVAAILEALRTMGERKLPHRPIELLLTVAEELYCLGGSHFDTDRLKAREVYVLDLSGPVGTAALRAPTILSFTVTVEGKASHAGFAPERGVHAVQAAALAVSRLELGHVGREMTVNVGRFQGGGAQNIVPDQCTVTGEVRGYDNDEVMQRLALIGETFRQAADELGATVSLTREIAHAAYAMDIGHPAVTRFKDACGRASLEPKLISTFGGSDYNVLYQRGLRGLVISNAMENCHGVSEYTMADELERAANLTLQLMLSQN